MLPLPWIVGIFKFRNFLSKGNDKVIIGTRALLINVCYHNDYAHVINYHLSKFIRLARGITELNNSTCPWERERAINRTEVSKIGKKIKKRYKD